MTDTMLSLLAAIRENPAEDAPRLVWADWLEENAGTVQRCSGTHRHDGEKLPLISGGFAWDAHGVIHRANPKQPHHHCDEKCRVSDGRAELAEFVRVQVGIHSSYCAACKGDGKYYEDGGPYESRWVKCRCDLSKLRTRERELWPAVRGVFDGDGVNLWRERWPGSNTATPAVLVSRGLPAVVRCTLAEWMGGWCEGCTGAGYSNGGIIGDADFKCSSCHGTGRTPGIGPRLAQRWPITEVQVEKQPMGSGREFLWLMREDRPGVASPGSAALPASVFDLLKGYRKYIRGARAKCYPDEPAARAALSDATIAWARSQPIGEGRS